MKSSEIDIQNLRGKEKAEAFSEIVRTYQERIYWHIRKMVLDHDDANDLLQNTFMKAWSALDKFRGDSQLSTWLYRIATNETLTFLTSKKNQTLSINDLEDSTLERIKADEYFDGDEAQLLLQKAILTLPEKQRLVFNMRFYDDINYEQMSEILDTSVGALKASYHHASKKIEDYIRGERKNDK